MPVKYFEELRKLPDDVINNVIALDKVGLPSTMHRSYKEKNPFLTARGRDWKRTT